MSRAVPGVAVSALVAIGCCALSGCQPPLTLADVEAAEASPVRRTDEFQSAARHGRTLVVVGAHGLVVVSQDSGTHWQRATLPGWPALIAVADCGVNTFAAISYEGSLWLSVDDARTWSPRPLGANARPQAITCDASGRIWVVGESATLLSSGDRGNHWQRTTLDQQDLFLTTIQFVDGLHGYITGEFGTVLGSSDAGASWQKLPSLPGDIYPEAAHFSDMEHGWAVGLNGSIVETTDAARHWAAAEAHTTSPLYGIASDGGVAYAVGGDGAILQQTARGWSVLPDSRKTHSYLRVILRTEEGGYVVAGGAGTLFTLAGTP
ncbi:MAG: hypothetical protein JSR66_21275 [Proteobacteria bacterium]|nr:hypothetical protein [Pseudomonadota bacterium]